jgi:hypothetical protein
MNFVASNFLALANVLLLVGCDSRQTASPPQQSAPSPVATRKPELTRDEVLQRFRERATPDQIQEFERLRAASDKTSGERAVELVLFTLTDDELFKIGITRAVGFPGWAVASSVGAPNVKQAVSRAFEAKGISAMVSCSHGRCSWYVTREQFFSARRALLDVTNMSSNDLAVVEPMFSLQ